MTDSIKHLVCRLVSGAHHEQQRALDALANHGVAGAAALADLLLTYSDWSTHMPRAKVVEVLKGLDTTWVPGVAERIASREAELNSAIAEAMGASGEPAALDLLRTLLQTGNAGERELAMWGLGFSPSGAKTALVALDDPEPAVRELAAIALGRFPYHPAHDKLLEALVRGHDDTDTTVALIGAFGALGNPDDAPVLAQFVESPKFPVRDAALRELASLNPGLAADLAMGLLDSSEEYDRDLAAEVLEAAAEPHQRTRLVSVLDRPDLQHRVHSRAPTIRERIERAIERLDSHGTSQD